MDRRHPLQRIAPASVAKRFEGSSLAERLADAAAHLFRRRGLGQPPPDAVLFFTNDSVLLPLAVGSAAKLRGSVLLMDGCELPFVYRQSDLKTRASRAAYASGFLELVRRYLRDLQAPGDLLPRPRRREHRNHASPYSCGLRSLRTPMSRA